MDAAHAPWVAPARPKTGKGRAAALLGVLVLGYLCSGTPGLTRVPIASFLAAAFPPATRPTAAIPAVSPVANLGNGEVGGGPRTVPFVAVIDDEAAPTQEVASLPFEEAAVGDSGELLAATYGGEAQLVADRRGVAAAGALAVLLGVSAFLVGAPIGLAWAEELTVVGAVAAVVLPQAVRGGLAGSVSSAANILLLGGFRAVMNYQYRHGGTRKAAFQTLWSEGGFGRFYRGVGFALLEGPLARFGSWFANTFVFELRARNTLGLQGLPVLFVTMLATSLAATWRCLILPIDTLQTVSQVEGRAGFQALLRRALREGKVKLLYAGASAVFLGTLTSQLPWFLTYNYLQLVVPRAAGLSSDLPNLARTAAITFCASTVSDLFANPLRVLKVSKQSRSAANATGDGPPAETGYLGIMRSIIAKEGAFGFFTRGLTTRMFINSLSSIIFTVVFGLIFKSV